jgi:hypothetical protein
MTNELRVPLFPLHSVLFPQGPLPLRVFEPRYLEMVSECLRSDGRFGVCLIESGDEVGPAPKPYDIGTLARIVDWQRLPDGLLGITALGETRFRILERRVRPNQLLEAEVELLPEPPPTALPAEYLPMADFLRQMLKHIAHLFAHRPPQYGDAGWVGCRLAELLPLPLAQKQHLLQIDEPIQRLERIRRLMISLNIQS